MMEEDFIREMTLLTENDSAVPTREQVEEWLERYPYFTFPAFLLLKRAPESVDDEFRSHLVNRLALSAPDARTLMEL
ncbi:MAG: hypothetical protein K2K55_01515, partial [Duncaniella sp.]|nr:hypothetical protein [Duncaniella sp.]